MGVRMASSPIEAAKGRTFDWEFERTRQVLGAG
jgi:hypothetical protein